MKVADLLNESTIQITPTQDGWLKISTPDTKGPQVSLIYAIRSVATRKGLETLSKSGQPIDFRKFKANGFLVKTSEKEAKAIIAKVESERAKEAADKPSAEETKAKKASAAKSLRQYNKSKEDNYDELYGKGTWKRITAKQEGGDDGYSYVIRVDGKQVVGGLTKSEVDFEKRQAAQKLAKKEKLGKYAD
jgi:hypothetical protein